MQRSFLAFVAAAAVSACSAAADDGSTASFSYASDGTTLHAYPLEPAPDIRAPEKLAKRVYGDVLRDVRSPLYRYFCTWRPGSRTGPVSPDKMTGPWERILLFCVFGTDRWSPPSNILEAGEAIRKRQEARVRMDWEWRGKDYVLVRFNVEMEGPASPSISSTNRDPVALSNVGLAFHKMKFPVGRQDEMSFDLSARLPRHIPRAGRMKPKPETYTVNVQGTAAPTPPWLNY